MANPKEPDNPFDEPTVAAHAGEEDNPFDPPTVKVSVPVSNADDVDYLTIAQMKAPPALAALPGVPAFTPGSLHSGERAASPFDSDPGPTDKMGRPPGIDDDDAPRTTVTAKPSFPEADGGFDMNVATVAVAVPFRGAVDAVDVNDPGPTLVSPTRAPFPPEPKQTVIGDGDNAPTLMRVAAPQRPPSGLFAITEPVPAAKKQPPPSWPESPALAPTEPSLPRARPAESWTTTPSLPPPHPPPSFELPPAVLPDLELVPVDATQPVSVPVPPPALVPPPAPAPGPAATSQELKPATAAALAGLKPASSLSSQDMKAATAAALASLKPAKPATTSQDLRPATSSQDLRPAPPRSTTSQELSPRAASGRHRVNSGPVPAAPQVDFSAKPEPLLPPEYVRWTLYGAAAVVVVAGLVALRSLGVAAPTTVDLPRPQLPDTALGCKVVTTRGKKLLCELRASDVDRLTELDRAARYEVTRGVARAAGFDTVLLQEDRATWGVLDTAETAKKRPARRLKIPTPDTGK